MTPISPDAPDTPTDHGHTRELRREGLTTALYVAICVVAALIALPETADPHLPVLGVIWGISIGLALAHWFAFRLSARMVGAGKVSPEDVQSATVQLVGAAATALLASLPVVFLPASLEVGMSLLALSIFISVVGYHVARAGGATRPRALVYALAVLVIAVGTAALKNILSGH
ncbi:MULTISPECIES: hypothetical protein [Citricoccus]|uniref:hypothetical protein n=1 Tax=Citricoccus TaxID=169133 RepID=UPI000255EBEB|nr:hypothetical protein [Citricoccus sp. CH26A]